VQKLILVNQFPELELYFTIFISYNKSFVFLIDLIFSSDACRNRGTTLRSLARRRSMMDTRHGSFPLESTTSDLKTVDISVIFRSARTWVRYSPNLEPSVRSAIGSLMTSMNDSKCSGVMDFLITKLLRLFLSK